MARRATLTLGELCPRWDGFLPGTRYACDSPYLGREVQLRKGATPVRVLACTSPPWVAPAARAKLSKRRACEGGFEVDIVGGLGVPTVVRGSKVRERLRVREGLCPDALEIDPHQGYVAYTEREAHRAGRAPYADGGELPFPHRLGSTPCCKNSPSYPDKVEQLLSELEAGEGFLDADDVVAVARTMVPKALKSEVKIRSIAEIPAAIEAVREHCWGVVKAWEDKHERTAIYSSAREGAAERRVAQLAEDLGVTRSTSVGVGVARRRVEAGWTDKDAARKDRGKKAALTYFRAG